MSTLDAFRRYLIEIKELSHSTSETRVGYVAIALREGMDPHDNDRFADYVETYATASRSSRRGAWRHYQAFCGVPEDERLPAASRRRRKVSKADPAEQFGEWLVSERGYQPSSAASYSSRIRAALRACESLTPTREQLDEWLNSKSLGYRSQFTKAWNLWRVFRRNDAADLSDELEVPDDVAYAAHYLASQVRMKREPLRDLVWADVVERPVPGARNAAEIVIRQSAGVYYRQVVPQDVVDILHAWALPEDDTAYVLVAERGSVAPMTRQQLHGTLMRGATLVSQGYRATAPVRPPPSTGDEFASRMRASESSITSAPPFSSANFRQE